nr:amidohydrolase family protein [Nocardia otitidiscaviarum]
MNGGNVLIKSVRLYGEGEPVDVLLADGEIRQIGTDLGITDAEIVDGTGQYLLPGFVDLHTHLREPGREDTETIETGSAAAALGGYTAVLSKGETQNQAHTPAKTTPLFGGARKLSAVGGFSAAVA